MNLLLQIFLLLIVAVVLGGIALLVFSIASSVSADAKDRLAKRNVSLSSTGATVGVKGKSRDKYLADTQRVAYGAWRTGETKGYRSWLWGSGAAADQDAKVPVGDAKHGESGSSVKTTATEAGAPVKDVSNRNRATSGSGQHGGLSKMRSAPP